MPACLLYTSRLFDLDGVELQFSDDALDSIAEQAVERKIGARGLRAIMEKVMTDIMYEIPSDDRVGRCLITKDVVEGKALPQLTYRDTEVRKRKGETA